MKAPAFNYHVPRTIEGVLALLAMHDNARVLGGGQSLMPMLNLRVAGPDHLIDLGRIPELVGIEERDDVVVVRAMTTQRVIERSDVVRRHVPLLGMAIDHIGHQQTRNRGTVGGSICHLDPGAELPVAAAALDTTLVVQGPQGRRRLQFANFPVAHLTNSLEPDEILVEIEFPKARARSGSSFLEFNQRPADFAVVSVGIQLSLTPAQEIEAIAIALGGIQYAPLRLAEAEAVLIGSSPTEGLLGSALATFSEIEVEGDELYPSEYRREICGVLIERALGLAMQRARSFP